MTKMIALIANRMRVKGKIMAVRNDKRGAFM